MKTINERIIKLLGGYTKKEYIRAEQKSAQKYKALLDSKTNFTCTKVVNEYIRYLLRDVNRYMKDELYGKDLQIWVDKMWNVMHNNWLKLEIISSESDSIMPYRIDLNLDDNQEFTKILNSHNDKDEIDYILDNLLETD